jgi:uncharacterized SAM-binding protein YcdF (DUF218 family)
MNLDIVEGTNNLDLRDIAHVLVPGRGRDESGFGLTHQTADRIAVAQVLYNMVVKPSGGRVVCSGYKSPIDRKGATWSPTDSPDEIFCGMPEADIMRDGLISLGVSKRDIFAERHSIDTASNFLRSELEGYFGDSRPVAIVAQQAHLRRMLTVIAPRTLRRPYLGIAVQETTVTRENPLAGLVSAAVLRCLPDKADRAIEVAERRTTRIWRVVRLVGVRKYH